MKDTDAELLQILQNAKGFWICGRAAEPGSVVIRFTEADRLRLVQALELILAAEKFNADS